MMLPQKHTLKDGRQLLVRPAAAGDAAMILEYIQAISGESDFLTFGPGEFVLTLAEEATILEQYRRAENMLYLVGLLDGDLAATLSFSAGQRLRLRHSGELSMAVRKAYWGLGIGSLMLDSLIDWAKNEGIIRKINLRVRSDNRRAINLYSGKGFVVEGTIHREIFLAGRYFDYHWMGLEL